MAEGMFGPYRLDRLVGRGGMGAVWRAFDTRKHDRLVALKLLSEQLSDDDEFRTRFQREAEIVALLREPHVIPIHDYGEIEGKLYLEMRLVDGVDLANVLEHDGPLAPERAVAVVEQVAAALDAAHAQGLVHRDVKPSNILATPGPPEFVYLVDFGIARGVRTTARGRLTSTGATVGTLEYMAPERFLGDTTDARADVYALACVLFELLAGGPPFIGEMPALVQPTSVPPPSATENRTGLPPGLDDVIARGMAKQPADRYPTAGDLAAAARTALAGRETAASPTRASVGSGSGPSRTPPLLPTQLAGDPSPSPAPRRVRWLTIGAAAAVTAGLVIVIIGFITHTRSVSASPTMQRPAQVTTAPSAQVTVNSPATATDVPGYVTSDPPRYGPRALSAVHAPRPPVMAPPLRHREGRRLPGRRPLRRAS